MTAPNMKQRSLWYMGNYVKIHADAADTNGRFSMLEFFEKPGSEPPPHAHQNEDEMFLVLEGEMRLYCGSVEWTLRAGESAIVPRRVLHTFRILTPTAHIITTFTPAGFEDFFRVLGEPAEEGKAPDYGAMPSRERIAEIAAKYGSRIAA